MENTSIWYTWGDVFNASLLELWGGLIQFAPKLVFAIVLFIIGWIVGSLVAKAFEQVFSALKIDKLFHSVGAGDLFNRSGMSLNTGYFVGQVMKWFVIIVFLLPSLNVLGLEYVASFLKDDVLGFLPRVIVAALMLIIASILAEVVSKAVSGGAKALSVTHANMLGSIAKYSIWVFAFIIALGQLGIAEPYMSTLFAGIIGMLALAGGLAFGLGGRDAASKFVSKISDEISHRG